MEEHYPLGPRYVYTEPPNKNSEFSDKIWVVAAHLRFWEDDSALPIRSPKGDLGPLGDFLVKIGPPIDWYPLHQKSPFQSPV